MTSDVTVFGAGLFGLSVAWACAARGARVTVVDPAGPGGGASGGPVGALAPHAPENWSPVKAFQRDALLMAEGFWADVAAASGRDPGFARCGRLQPIADDVALARNRDRAAAAALHWRGRAVWQVIRATGAAWEPLSPSGWLVHDTLTGRVSPRAACAALAAAVVARGGRILAESPAGAGAQVWATGWQGLEALSLGGGEKGQAARLVPPSGTAPVTDRPMIMAPGVFVVPHADGSVAVGSTAERDWSAPDTTDAQLDAVLARASALIPALAGWRVAERWAGVRPRAVSRQLVLGPHPARPGVFLANGGFKTGVALAPLAGTLLAELILDGRDRIPAAFRPGG
jgi:glycine oxidase